MLNKYWKVIQNAAKSEADILIYEEIGADWFGDGLTAKAFAQDLKSLGNVTQINLFINSPGGSVFDGLAMYNQLKAHPANVTVRIDGLAASIASVIAMAGDEIIMPENAIMMIHDPFAAVVGNADDLRGMADSLDKVKSGLISAYARKTGLDDETIGNLMSEETWMTAAEAAAHGFIDQVADEVQIAAHFDLTKFKNYGGQLKMKTTKMCQCGNALDKNGQCEKCTDVKDKYTERERVTSLLAIGKEFNYRDDADRFIEEGKSIEDFRLHVLSKIKNNHASSNGIGSGPVDFLGTNGQKKELFSRPRIQSAKYRDLFNVSGPLDMGDFKNVEDFMSAVRTKAVHRFSNAHSEAVPSEGGFSVPGELAAWLMDQSLEDEIIRPRATVWPMLSSSREVPCWDGYDHSSNLFGGFSGVWLGEGGTATNQKGKVMSLGMTAHKLACYSQMTNELREDGLTFEEMMTSAMKKAVSWFLDLAFLTGTGAGKPLGLLNSPSLITVTKETGQLASTIQYENLTKMYARLHPSCHKNAVWLCNSTAIPQLLELTLALGTGGTHFPVLKESNGTFSIFGKEVIFTEKLPALGTEGDIILTDLKQYHIGLRRDMSIDRDQGPGWLEDTESYRVILRADGQSSWKSAITPKNGDTLSNAVTLATRS